jgi:cold shock CspA family protein
MNPDSQPNLTLDQEITPCVGRVKWFNNKAGYGFITIMSDTTEELNKGSDIFVHHTSINVINEQYKYLVQGEYVEFKIIHTTDSEHEFQAGQISGIFNGKLMCETIRDIKSNKIQYRQNNNGPQLDTQQMLSLPVFNTVSSYEDDKEFTTIRKPQRTRNMSQGPPATPRNTIQGVSSTQRKTRSGPTSIRRQSFFQQSGKI